MKTAFIFPGQGSQYIGMGQDLYNNWPQAKELYHAASEILGINMAKLCFEGPEEELVQTQNTQPALLVTSIACFQLLKSKGVFPAFVAGHSLGEYSALVAANSLKFEDAVDLVRKRGTYMREAVPDIEAGMAAIIGLEDEVVKSICLQAQSDGLVEAANYNCPGQVVISGVEPALAKALELAKQAGAKMAVKLNVSGPFHSSLMKKAGEKLATDLSKVTVKGPEVPLLANFNAEFITDGDQVKNALIRQISGSVLWTDTVLRMINEGVKVFIEVGPSKVLSGLVKKIDRKVTVCNVEDFTSLEKALAKLEEVS